MIFWIIFGAVGGFLFFCFLFFSFLPFYNYKYKQLPKTNSLKTYSTKFFKDSIFLTDGYKLLAYYHHKKNNKPLLVYVQTLGAHLHELMWLQELCKKKQYSYLFYTHRYSSVNNIAKNIFDYNSFQQLRDCEEILTSLRKQHPNKRIIVFGHSLGAGILGQILISKSFQKLNLEFGLINIRTKEITKSPFYSFWKFFKYFFWYPKNKILKISAFFTPEFFPFLMLLFLLAK